MSYSNIDLEKSVWTYKLLKDEELSNENNEVILNFFEKNKFELNINRYKSAL